jgi:hypothetical protein
MTGYRSIPEARARRLAQRPESGQPLSCHPVAGALAGMRGLGDPVGPDQPLAVVHARSTAEAVEAAAGVREAMVVGEGPAVPVGPPVLQRIGPAE